MERRSAGGIVLGDSGTVALVRSRTETGWFFPKGGIEPEETPEEAARREIEEETSLTGLELIDDLGSYARPRIDAENRYVPDETKVIHMFLFAAEPHTPIQAAHEIAEAVWMPLKLVAESLQDDKDRAWFASVFERVRQAVQRD